jgi:hypothetical protein
MACAHTYTTTIFTSHCKMNRRRASGRGLRQFFWAKSKSSRCIFWALPYFIWSVGRLVGKSYNMYVKHLHKYLSLGKSGISYTLLLFCKVQGLI